MKNAIVLLFAFIFLFTSLNAQKLYGTFEDDYDFDMFDWDFRNPTIEVNYGNSYLKHKTFDGKFSMAGLTEIRLGYNKTDDYEDIPYIKEFSERVLILSNKSTEISGKSNEMNKYKSDTWMAGFGTFDGYGYQAGGLVIIPYNGDSFIWTKFNSADLSPETENVIAEKPLLRFNNAIRFGTASEAGIRLQPLPFLSVNAAFETNVVFPRHLFWKHLISGLIELGSQSVADKFVEKIMDSSPAAGPIVSFVLKTGISYGFYKLKQEKMNWPFKTETPLTFENFKIGMSFTF